MAGWLGGWVQEQAKRLVLPDQSIHVVSGLHNLQEHERVAIAVERASRTGPSPSLPPERLGARLCAAAVSATWLGLCGLLESCTRTGVDGAQAGRGAPS